MNALRLASLVTLALVGNSAPAVAATPAEPPPPHLAAADFAAVEQFLDLSDAQLDEVMQVIARIRAMSPEQRTALRKEITAFRALPETQRHHLRQGWGHVPHEQRDGWHELMQAATPERREEIRTRLQALPPEARTAYRQKLVEEFLAQRNRAPAEAPPNK